MQKILGRIGTVLIAVLTWIAVFLTLLIISAFIWRGEGEEMAGWYILVLLIVPIIVATFSGIRFYGKYIAKHFLPAQEQVHSEEKKCEMFPDTNLMIYKDEMLPPAMDVILETRQATVSMLQRRLKLGYARAARILDEMEKLKIVGPFQGSKPREILVTKEHWMKMLQNATCIPENCSQNGGDDLQTNTKLASLHEYGGLAAELLTIDLMEGHDFEYWCAEALRDNGFTNVEVTKGSGDQGVDVLATKDNIKYAFQCKRYKTTLGNTPVQEVLAGKQFYGCHVCGVITNQFFSTRAKELAERTGCILWDRTWIAEYINKKHGITSGGTLQSKP